MCIRDRCRSELQSLKDIYPSFASKVDFYAIGQSQVETIDQLEHDRIEQGYPWPIAKVENDVLKKLKVLHQSTKIALDHKGVILYRAGYGDGEGYKWREVFFNLAGRSGG